MIHPQRTTEYLGKKKKLLTKPPLSFSWEFIRIQSKLSINSKHEKIQYRNKYLWKAPGKNPKPNNAWKVYKQKSGSKYLSSFEGTAVIQTDSARSFNWSLAKTQSLARIISLYSKENGHLSFLSSSQISSVHLTTHQTRHSQTVEVHITKLWCSFSQITKPSCQLIILNKYFYMCVIKFLHAGI